MNITNQQATDYFYDDRQSYSEVQFTSYSTVTSMAFGYVASELGFFFLFSTIGSGFFLHQVQGKPFRLRQVLMNRDWQLLESDSMAARADFILMIVSWGLFVMPLLCLGVWSGLIMASQVQNGDTPLWGICLGLVGLAFIFFAYTLLKIFWSNYRLYWKNISTLCLAYLCLTGYQFIVVFLDQDSQTFFAFTAIFLSVNATIIMFAIYLNTGSPETSMRDFLTERLKQGEPKDSERTANFDSEILKERQNMDFIPTIQDVTDLFTIKDGDSMKDLFGNGIQHHYSQLSVHLQRTITMFLWIFASGLLVIYAFIIYWWLDSSRLGFVTAIAVGITDIFLLLLYNASIMQSTSLLCFTAVLNRFFLFIFGGDYWIYGYNILYIYYGVILSLEIGARRFPLEEAFANINLKVISKKQSKTDISKIPEVALAFITGILVILFVAVGATQPYGVPLNDLVIGQTSYKFYMTGIFSIFLVVTFFSLYSTYRLFIRKQKVIKSSHIYYVNKPSCDLYWIFIVISYACLMVYALIATWISWNISYLIIGSLGSLTLVLYLNCYLYYVMNDHEFLENIKAINAKIEKHNKSIIEVKAKVVQVKQDLKQGNTQIFGSKGMSLAQDIMNRNKYQRTAKKATIDMSASAIDRVLQTDAAGRSLTSLSLLNNQRSPNPDNKLSNRVRPEQTVSQPNSSLSASQARSSNLQNRIPEESKIADVNVKSKTMEDLEADRLLQEELKRITQPKKQDDIYEGGEQETVGKSKTTGFLNNTNLDQNALLTVDNQANLEGTQDLERMLGNADELGGIEQSDASSDEELDPNSGEYFSEQKRARKRIKDLVDWRDSMNAFEAYFTRNLRSNDYQIINSWLLSMVTLGLMAWLICWKQQSYIGITIAVPFLHYYLAYISLSRHLSTDSRITDGEIALFFISFIVQYGWGVAALFLDYDVWTIDFQYPQGSSVGYFIVVYLNALPFSTSAFAAILKWIDDNGRFSGMFLSQLVFALFQGLAMLICAYIWIGYVSGAVISAIIVLFIYIVIQVFTYVNNNYYLPVAWRYTNFILGSIVVVGPFVVSFFFRSYLVFEGVTLSIWTLCFFLMMYSVGFIVTDLRKSGQRPIFISPWLFPVYVYDPLKNDVIERNGPIASMMATFIILIVWAVSCTVWVQPTFVGVCLSIALEKLMAVVCLYLTSTSQRQFKSIMPYIDNMIIRLAWLDAKAGHVQNKAVQNRAQLITYQKQLSHKHIFQLHIQNLKLRSLEGLQQPQPNEYLSSLDKSQVDLFDQRSCEKYMAEVQREVDHCYLLELEFMVQFQLLILQQAQNLQDQERKYLFSFIIERKAALFALGITLNVPQQGAMAVRYARVIQQIQSLTPEKQTAFNNLRFRYIKYYRNLEIQQREMARIEDKKQKERLKMMEQASQEKRKQLELVTEDMEVDAMPDCEFKYAKIMKEALQKKKIFEDKAFTHDEKSLGPQCLNRGIAGWKRARDDPNAVLFRGQVKPQDVTQGALGDCYFLSAISVLGDQYVRNIIVFMDNQEEWRNSGAFQVKFFKDGYTEVIVIDDYFPVYGNGEWAFVKGGADGSDIWPMVLEKAYAKLYGSYSYIEAGKVQYALADMTDGFPEQIDLNTEGKSIPALWERIKGLRRHGALMGAGTPENALGDKATNEMGIVQGHAYAVMDVQELDGNRLLQVRNPHGSQGSEWKGDWCDDSAKWTQRIRNKLNHQTAQSDGIFWMDIVDFVQQYSTLSICRILGTGWKEVPIRDQWKGKTAEGLPSRAYPNARLDFNPQYEILVNKPCEGFIKLKQLDKVNTFKGKHAIFFMVSKINGQLIKKVDKATIICKSGNPINYNIVTAVCDFDKSVAYPYKFTLLIANAEHGPDGEGAFEASVYSMGSDMQITRLPPPSDF